MQRVCKALCVTPERLRSDMGVDKSDFEPLIGQRAERNDIDRDAVWWQLLEYVDHRLALIMAARADLNRALQKDREKRAVIIARQQTREGKGSLRERRAHKNNTGTDV